MRAMVMDRLSFQEAYRKYVRPDQQIYWSVAAFHRALDIEGTELYHLGFPTANGNQPLTTFLPPWSWSIYRHDHGKSNGKFTAVNGIYRKR